MTVDQLEQGIILRVGDAQLVGNDLAHVPRVHVRPDGQRLGQQRPVGLVGNDDFEDGLEFVRRIVAQLRKDAGVKKTR